MRASVVSGHLIVVYLFRSISFECLNTVNMISSDGPNHVYELFPPLARFLCAFQFFKDRFVSLKSIFFDIFYYSVNMSMLFVIPSTWL